jgi:hypothetical protein
MHLPASYPRWVSTLPYVSDLISYLIQRHVEFMMMWRKKREEVGERSWRSMKQYISHKLKFKIIRPLLHYCMSVCHPTHNIPPFFPYICK